MTKIEAIKFIQTEINTRGLSASEPEVEQGCFVVRVKHADKVCGSVTVTDNEATTGDENALRAKVLDALRAATKEPTLKGAA